MATSPGEWQEVGTTKGFEDKFSVPGLTEGQSYYFAVAAENEGGVGPLCELDRPVVAEKPKSMFTMFFVSILTHALLNTPKIHLCSLNKSLTHYQMTTF